MSKCTKNIEQFDLAKAMEQRRILERPIQKLPIVMNDDDLIRQKKYAQLIWAKLHGVGKMHEEHLIKLLLIIKQIEGEAYDRAAIKFDNSLK